MEVRLSLVIPARNESAFLPLLLDSVDVARRKFPGTVEVVVSDNASTDETARIARSRGCRVVPVEKRVIGAVRNGGARLARGEILAFVDADSRIHPDTFSAIDRCIENVHVVGGATGVTMERASLGIAASYALLVPLVWATGMDTGVVLCRREDFEALGGYREDIRVAEDVDFLWRLRRLGKSRRQRLSRPRGAKAVASTRKFDEYGDWHYLRNLGRSLFYVTFDRAALDSFVEDYWYRDRVRTRSGASRSGEDSG
jgi:glycosyltransferase involved in cell wall biosynthesis